MIPEDILYIYILLLFILFVVPRILVRYRLPTAITSLLLGSVAAGFNPFGHDTTVTASGSWRSSSLPDSKSMWTSSAPGPGSSSHPRRTPRLLRRRIGIRGHRPRGRCGTIVGPKGGPQDPHLARHVRKHGGSHQRPLGCEALP